LSKIPHQTLPPLDVSMLTEKEMEEARIRARRKLADEAAMAELGMTDRTMPVRQGPILIPDEDQFDITLDLFEASDRIVIDGRTFMHGGTYKVGKRVYDTLREIQARGWGHQAEIDGKDSNAYRRAANQILKPNSKAADA